jgi:hypothetical protein
VKQLAKPTIRSYQPSFKRLTGKPNVDGAVDKTYFFIIFYDQKLF